MNDPDKTLRDYVKTTSDVTLYFKDLGPQVGWDTVFYLEYAGPIVITLALIFFREIIYGRDPEFNLN